MELGSLHRLEFYRQQGAWQLARDSRDRARGGGAARGRDRQPASTSTETMPKAAKERPKTTPFQSRLRQPRDYSAPRRLATVFPARSQLNKSTPLNKQADNARNQTFTRSSSEAPNTGKTDMDETYRVERSQGEPAPSVAQSGERSGAVSLNTTFSTNSRNVFDIGFIHTSCDNTEQWDSDDSAQPSEGQGAAVRTSSPFVASSAGARSARELDASSVEEEEFLCRAGVRPHSSTVSLLAAGVGKLNIGDLGGIPPEAKLETSLPLNQMTPGQLLEAAMQEELLLHKHATKKELLMDMFYSTVNTNSIHNFGNHSEQHRGLNTLDIGNNGYYGLEDFGARNELHGDRIIGDVQSTPSVYQAAYNYEHFGKSKHVTSENAPFDDRYCANLEQFPPGNAQFGSGSELHYARNLSFISRNVNDGKNEFETGNVQEGNEWNKDPSLGVGNYDYRADELFGRTNEAFDGARNEPCEFESFNYRKCTNNEQLVHKIDEYVANNECSGFRNNPNGPRNGIQRYGCIKEVEIELDTNKDIGSANMNNTFHKSYGYSNNINVATIDSSAAEKPYSFDSDKRYWNSFRNVNENFDRNSACNIVDSNFKVCEERRGNCYYDTNTRDDGPTENTANYADHLNLDSFNYDQYYPDSACQDNLREKLVLNEQNIKDVDTRFQGNIGYVNDFFDPNSASYFDRAINRPADINRISNANFTIRKADENRNYFNRPLVNLLDNNCVNYKTDELRFRRDEIRLISKEVCVVKNDSKQGKADEFPERREDRIDGNAFIPNHGIRALGNFDNANLGRGRGKGGRGAFDRGHWGRNAWK